jgi:hypothetical protein
MEQQRCQHWCATGHHLGLCLALALGLTWGAQAAAAKECHRYKVDTMVLVGEAIRPFPCPTGSGEALPPERQTLSASDQRAELTGHTLYANGWHLFLTASGVPYGASKGGTEHDVGTWHITADSQFCNTWHMWRGWREHCFAVYWEGEMFELQAKDRLDKGVYHRRVLSNPEGY